MSTDTERTYQVTERVESFFGKYWNHCKNYLELCTFIVAPAVARCDIGIRFSVRPSFRPQFKLTLAFKSIQMTNSLPLQQWILISYAAWSDSKASE